MNMISISIPELRQLCTTALISKGASPDEATTVFDDYLDAELRGRQSHGFIAFSVALGSFPHTGTFAVGSHTGSVIHIHGNGDSGHIVARRGIDLALHDLDSKGIYAIGISDITRFNCPGSIARYAAERGALAIVLEYGGQNFMAPPGGLRAALSTNPIGIAIPGTDPLFVVDIATSERAIGYVSIAKSAGTSIPSSWGIDDRGEHTTDPSKLVAVTPFGGYKGYGLALAFEILSGALVGVPIGRKGTLSRRGAMILLIHPTIFGRTTSEFISDVREFLDSVTATESIDPSRPVRYPGQSGEDRAYAIRLTGQLTLPGSVLEQLRKATS